MWPFDIIWRRSLEAVVGSVHSSTLFRLQAQIATECQEQHSQPEFTFLDVAHRAPTLISLLPHESCAALSACSKQLQQLVQQIRYASRDVITVKKIANFQAVIKRDWPSLLLVILLNHKWMQSNCNWFAESGLELQAVLSAAKGECHHAVLMVRPTSGKNSSAQPLEMQKQMPASFATASSQLQNNQWELLKKIDITGIHLRSINVMNSIYISAAASCRWEGLVHLDVSNIKLDATAVSDIVRGFSGPSTKLEALVLSNTSLNTAAVTQLAEAHWPKLQLLNLDHNHLIDADAIAVLANLQQWPMMAQLLMCGIEMSSTSVTKLVQVYRRKLTFLGMGCSNFGTASMAALVAARCPHLSTLDLVGNALDAHAIGVLVASNLRKLCCLSLRNNHLDERAIEWLAKGQWPYLTQLHLQHNRLNNMAMMFLVQGWWPHLAALYLSENPFDCIGVGCLLAGRWPHLKILELCKTASTPATWHALKLDVTGACDSTCETSDTVLVPRMVDNNWMVWPSLTAVHFTLS